MVFFGITKYLTEFCKYVKRAYAHRKIKCYYIESELFFCIETKKFDTFPRIGLQLIYRLYKIVSSLYIYVYIYI